MLLLSAALYARAQRTHALIYSQNSKGGGHTLFGNTIMAIYSSGSGTTGGTVNTAEMNDFNTSNTGVYSGGRTSAYGNDNSNMQFTDIDGLGGTAISTVTLSDFNFGSPNSEDWRYYSLASYTAPPSGWQTTGSFTNWTQADAPFRFGGFSGGTTLPTGSMRTRNTYYFSKEINFTRTDYSNYSITVRYDDGVVVYVNGTEVGRADMDDGAVDYNTTATDCNTSTTSYRTATFSVPAALLEDGTNATNVIAAEVHQGPSCGGTADMYFDLALNAKEITDNAASSSSADLVLPAGTNKIKFARLYWGGRYTTPFTAADEDIRSVMIRKGTSGKYATIITPESQVDIIGNTYQCYADITGFVSSSGAGTYTVGNITATPGSFSSGGAFAGWSILVVYENSLQTDYYSTRVYDGFLQVYAGGNATTLETVLTGLDAPSNTLAQNEAYLSAFAWEGDANLAASTGNPAGDFVEINGHPYSDTLNPASNVWNGTISRNGTFLSTGNPYFLNHMGIDIDEVYVGANYGIQPDTNEVNILFGTEADQYFPSIFAFSMKMKPPVLNITKFALGNKQFVPNDTARSAHLGETYTYYIYGRNSGAGDALHTYVVDSIPAGTTYVPGSLSIINAAGGTEGAMTDAAGDDQAYISTAASGRKYVVFNIGTGATAGSGGVFSPAANYVLSFKVTGPSAPGPLTSISNVARIIADTFHNEATFFIPIGNPLPVTLSGFSATVKGATAQLHWTTASERDCDHFDVQHSTNGVNFNTLGRVAAAGTSSLQHEYAFVHDNPEEGNNFYRLKIVDKDETFTYSPVCVLRFGHFSDVNVQVVPNPTTGRSVLVLPATLNNNARVLVYDNVGALVYKAGAAGTSVVSIDLGALPGGLYYAVVADDSGFNYRAKILKL